MHVITTRATGKPAAPPGLPVVRGLTVPYVLSMLITALLLVTSVAGLAFGQRGLYHPDPTTLPTFLGQDAITLAVGLPLLLWATQRARGGSLRGLLVWMGTLYYFAYAYAFYLLDPHFKPLFLVYAIVVAASTFGLLYLLLATDADAVRARYTARAPAQWLGGFLAVTSAAFAVLWAAMITSAVVLGTIPPARDVVVWTLDLTVALPAAFWGGVWLWRREALGYVAGPLLLMKVAFLGFTLVVNTWLVTLWDIAVDPVQTAGFVVLGLGGLAGTVMFFRSEDEDV